MERGERNRLDALVVTIPTLYNNLCAHHVVVFVMTAENCCKPPRSSLPLPTRRHYFGHDVINRAKPHFVTSHRKGP